MQPPTVNLHTHTYRCRHATGEVEDYASAAIRAGLMTLGMSDHVALPDGRWGDIRMALSEMDGYIAAVEAARLQNPSLRILLGAECEHSHDYQAWYQDELLGRRGFNYLVSGCHFVPERGAWVSVFSDLDNPGMLARYASYNIHAMRSGLYAFVAHPDIIGLAVRDWSESVAACARDICQASVALGVPLEMNSYGLRKEPVLVPDGVRPGYPWIPFWELAAEEGVSVVLNSDAHRPEDVAAGLVELEEIRVRLGLRLAGLDFTVQPGRPATSRSAG